MIAIHYLVNPISHFLQVSSAQAARFAEESGRRHSTGQKFSTSTLANVWPSAAKDRTPDAFS